MALPDTNITTMMVRNELGENTNNVGKLCASTKINPYSNNKPASLISPGGGYVEGDSVKPHGIYRLGKGPELYYNRPNGGASDPYRLGDFRGYNHLIGKPTTIIINSVKDITYGTTGAPTLSPPYKMYPSFIYRIQLSMLRGDIDPSTISANTAWDKKTGTAQGVGGVALVPFTTSENNVVDASLVFDGGATIDYVNTEWMGNPLRAHYVKRDYEPIIGEEWRSTGYEIENNNYIALFQGVPLDLSITASLFYSSFDDRLIFSGVITSGMDNYVRYRLRFQYQPNGGDWRNLASQESTASNGDTPWTVDIPMTYFQPGANTCDARVYLDIKNPDDSFTQLELESDSRPFTRSA